MNAIVAFTNGYYVEYFFVVVVAFFPWFCWFVHKTKKCLYIRRCLPRFQECLTGLSDLNDNRRKAFLWIMLKNSLFIWRQREPKISSSDDKIEQCKHQKVTWNSASNLICEDFLYKSVSARKMRSTIIWFMAIWNAVWRHLFLRLLHFPNERSLSDFNLMYEKKKAKFHPTTHINI